MKKVFKKMLAMVMATCFIFAFSLTANATGVSLVVSEIASNLNQENYELIEYDCRTNTERIISSNDLTDYASFANMTYELSAMAENITVDLECIEDSLVLPTSIYDDTQAFYLTQPKNGNSYTDPYAGVVYLEMKTLNNSGQIKYYRGTGFMVSPDVMVTAMHNFLEPSYTTTEMFVYPFVYSSTNSFTTTAEYAKPAKWVYLNNYKLSIEEGTSDWYAYDWCVVKLEEPIENVYCFNVANADSMNLAGKAVTISGYPKCVNLSCPTDCSHRICYLASSRGNIIIDSAHKIYYTNNTNGGSSGSPIYSPSEGCICYGIHTSSIDSGNPYETSYASVYNGGVWINSTIFNCISEFISMELN